MTDIPTPTVQAFLVCDQVIEDSFTKKKSLFCRMGPPSRKPSYTGKRVPRPLPASSVYAGKCAPENTLARDGSVHWGRIELEFDPEFATFRARWSYCEEPVRGRHQFTGIAEASTFIFEVWHTKSGVVSASAVRPRRSYGREAEGPSGAWNLARIDTRRRASLRAKRKSGRRDSSAKRGPQAAVRWGKSATRPRTASSASPRRTTDG